MNFSRISEMQGVLVSTTVSICRSHKKTVWRRQDPGSTPGLGTLFLIQLLYINIELIRHVYINLQQFLLISTAASICRFHPNESADKTRVRFPDWEHFCFYIL